MKYCPIHLNYPIRCKETECAWYNENYNQCIVKTLANLYSEKLISEIRTATQSSYNLIHKDGTIEPITFKNKEIK